MVFRALDNFAKVIILVGSEVKIEGTEAVGSGIERYEFAHVLEGREK